MSNLAWLESIFKPDHEEEERLAELQMAFEQFHNEYFAVYVKNQFSIERKDKQHKEIRSAMFIIKSE
jgi:hypothetical protein